MPRPVTRRAVPQGLDERIFKPLAVPAHALEHLEIGLDGLEALRLADLEGLYQAEAAARMGVSRATFARVLTEARRRVAEALIAGKALHVRGGAVTRRPDRRWPCPIHGGPGRRGRGCRCRRSRGDTGSDRTRRPR